MMMMVFAELSSSSDRFHPLSRQSKHSDPIDPTGGESPGIVIVYKKSSGGGGMRKFTHTTTQWQSIFPLYQNTINRAE